MVSQEEDHPSRKEAANDVKGGGGYQTGAAPATAKYCERSRKYQINLPDVLVAE